MRRTDRELTPEETLSVLERGEYGVLSLVELAENGAQPYAVPLSYALADGAIYIHCTAEGGRKIEAISQQAEACFVVVAETEVLPEKFSTKYWSAIAYGKVEIITDKAAKKEALGHLLAKYCADYLTEGQKYIAASVDKVTILRLPITTMTGKARKK